ncbi:hypothetical protein ABZT23_02370 [Streptomyces sp. NPDC005386]|uniref:hypothetical protein n=1 Tax=Streptomyces sp. NPDC005386 TaxID=3154562 RepID=UPI0033A15DB5
MTERLTLAGLSVPMRALRTLAAECGDLPAPTVSLSTVYPERLELHLHNGLGEFESWRVALGIRPDAVEFRGQSTGPWTLMASANYAGADILLAAYGHTAASSPADGGRDA